MLSGVPTKAGVHIFTVRVTDKKGKSDYLICTVNIEDTPAISGTLSNGKQGNAYSGSLTVSGGTAPYKWSYTGSLPPDLKGSSSGAKWTLSGKPTKIGTYSFAVKATDKKGSSNTKAVTVTIANPIVITSSLTNGKQGTTYSSSVIVSGGTATYKWSYTGTLPPGLKGSYSGTGAKWTLKGTPNKAGTYSFTLKATDKKGSSNTKAVKIVISDPLVISGTLKDGTQGTAYSGTLTVSKGRAPYKWTYTGSLPPGLKGSGSGAKWTLSWKPTKAGTYSFTVKATDKKGKSDTKSIKITIAEALAISGTLANGKVLEFYSSSIIALNGIGPYKWKLSGSLPPGLKSSYSGIGMTFEVFGIPTKAGTYKFTVKVTDSNGKSASKAFTIKISSSAFAYSAKTDSSTLDVGAEFFITSLSVASDDIIEAGEGAYSDIISIKAGVQVSFQVGTWVRPNGTLVAVDDATVFVDDEPLDDIAVAEDGTFELPTDMVADDFKVYVKGTTGSEELTTGTLYIRAEE